MQKRRERERERERNFYVGELETKKRVGDPTRKV